MVQENKMGVMPMTSLVVNMSLPLMISLLVQSLYNVVDSIFVARMGEGALAAVSLAFPVQVMMIAVSVGTAVGVNSLLSRLSGAQKFDEVTQVAATGIVLSVVGTCVFAGAGIFFASDIAAMMAEDAVIREYCREYLFICMAGCVGTFFETMYQRFLQSTGNTFDSMISLVSGALTNIVLDPILIFGLMGAPAMGVRGAAIATVIGQWVGAGSAIALNTLHNPTVRPAWRGWKLKLETLKLIYAVAVPTIATQMLNSVMLFCVNSILIAYSGTAVAFLGVFYRLQTFLQMPIIGMGQASVPIAGFNYGAGKKDRVLELLRTILWAAGILSIAMIAVFEFLPEQLLNLFSAGPEMLALGVPALRVIAPTFLPSAVTLALGFSLSGLGNGVINMWGSALRHVIVLVPCIWLLVSHFGTGAAWLAFWPAEFAAAAYAIFATLRDLKRKGFFPASAE